MDATTATASEVPKPHWNTSLNDAPKFAVGLQKWLPTVDASYSTLVSGRFALNGRYTICVSLNHIDRMMAKSYDKGTFAAPFPR